MKNRIQEYFLLTICVITLILAMIVLFWGCDSSAGTIDYRTLYNRQILENKFLKLENDSLKVRIDYLTGLINKVDSIYNIVFSESLQKIDSLKNIIALKDSNTFIMLQSIQDGLENLSDQGLNYLIELRKK